MDVADVDQAHHLPPPPTTSPGCTTRYCTRPLRRRAARRRRSRSRDGRPPPRRRGIAASACCTWASAAHAGAGGDDAGLGDVDAGLGGACTGGIVVGLLRGRWRGRSARPASVRRCGGRRRIRRGPAPAPPRPWSRRPGAARPGRARVSRALGVGDFGACLRELGLQGLDVHARDHVVALTKSPSFTRISSTRPGALAATSTSVASMRPLPRKEAAVVGCRAQELPAPAAAGREHRRSPRPTGRIVSCS